MLLQVQVVVCWQTTGGMLADYLVLHDDAHGCLGCRRGWDTPGPRPALLLAHLQAPALPCCCPPASRAPSQ